MPLTRLSFDNMGRDLALGVLVDLGDKRATLPLVEMLKSSQEYQRARAARDLGSLSDSRAVKPLVEALGDAYPAVRRAAAESLGRLKNTDAIGPLVARLSDTQPDVIFAVAIALTELNYPKARDVLLDVLSRMSMNLHAEKRAEIMEAPSPR